MEVENFFGNHKNSCPDIRIAACVLYYARPDSRTHTVPTYSKRTIYTICSFSRIGPFIVCVRAHFFTLSKTHLRNQYQVPLPVFTNYTRSYYVCIIHCRYVSGCRYIGREETHYILYCTPQDALTVLKKCPLESLKKKKIIIIKTIRY